MNNRETAMEWWHKMDLEQQFYKTIEANSIINGDRTRHPHTLTGSEIEKMFDFHTKKYVVLEHLSLTHKGKRFWTDNTKNNTLSADGELWYREVLFTNDTEEAIKACSLYSFY